MTDNEIIKALECCARPIHCGDCHYMGHNPCRGELITDAFHLVNRQNAVIESLEKQIAEMLISETCELHIPMEIAYRVRTEHPIFKAIKSEAFKEFAERLVYTLCINNEENTDIFDYAYTLETIGNLVKEMTE